MGTSWDFVGVTQIINIGEAGKNARGDPAVCNAHRRAARQSRGARGPVKACLAIFAVLLLLPSAASATALPGKITENMTLTAAGSPYTGSPTIEAGVTVNAEPGVTFKGGEINVNGTLKAEGTAEKPVLFTSSSDSGAGQWKGIAFNSGSGASIIDHVEVRYAGSFSNVPAIKIEGVSPTITHSTVRNSTYWGIQVEGGGSPEIAYDEVLNNGRSGIFYNAGTGNTGAINIHDNIVEGNSESGISISSPSTVTGTSLGGNTVKGNKSTAINATAADLPPDLDDNTLSENTLNYINFSGTLNQSATWTDHGYPMRGSLTVASGKTLTVGAGLTFKGGELNVNGTLIAEGTAEKPVIFTSQTDSEAGQWKGITFASTSGASLIDHAEVRYTGTFSHSAIVVEGGVSPTITHSTIRNNTYWGIQVEGGGSPEIAYDSILTNGRSGVSYSASGTESGAINIHDNLVEGNSESGIFVSSSSSSVAGTSLGGNTVKGNGSTAINCTAVYLPPDLEDNTLSGNTLNYVNFSGTLNQSATWTDHGFPLRGSLTIASAKTLTLGAGITFKGGEVNVNGTLEAEGTAEKPILFTSQSDSEAGQWKGITFASTSGASLIDHAEVRYAGTFSHAAIAIESASPTITHSTIRNDSYWGIQIEGGSPEIANDSILTNGRSGVSYSGGPGAINIHDNLIEGNSEYGVFVSSPSTVTGTSLGGNTVKGNESTAINATAADLPPDLDDNTLSGNAQNYINFSGTLNQSATWTDHGYPMKGSLTVASGKTLTVGAGITFKGGEVNVNGTLIAEGTAENPILFTSQSDSAPGQWKGITFASSGGASVIDHAEIRYAGTFSHAGIKIEGVSPTITHSSIRNNSEGGIKVTSSGKPSIQWTSFTGNSTFGLSYEGSGTLSAPHNYWGCASGPAPAGCGNSVSGSVNWRPQAEEDTAPGHCQGKETQCGVGADPVSLATGYLAYSHRDLLLTNKSSVPLEFTRNYNSADHSDSGLGPGWSQSGLASATELENGDVLIRRQDGRQDVFSHVGVAYVPPSGVTDSLVKTEEGTFTLTALDQTVYRFDTSGRIASITDGHGLKTTYGYSGEGRLSTITDPSGQTLTFAYNGSNHMTFAKDSTGREVSFGYSAAGDLETVTDALGGVTKYAYDANHRLTSITDPRSDVILKNVYNEQGQIVEQRDGLEHLWKMEYKPAETIVTEPEGGKLKYGFDGQDRVISETDQLGNKTTIAYDEAGNVHEVVKPGGAKWIYGHDAAGNLTSVHDPEGGERKYEYNAQNRPIGFADARGNAWSYEWSKAGDLAKIVDPEKGETTLTYNESGQPLTKTDPDKHKTEFSYDTRGNELSETDPLSHKTSFEYNSRNYLTSKTAPGLKAESYERDALGDLLARTTPEGHKTKYTYDANGLPTQITDPGEDIWKIERNAMERPTVYIDPLEQQIKLTYNGDLKPTKVVNRRGKETTYGYDAANQLTEVGRPEGEVWHFGYDSRGNRSSVIDPREHETTYEYDLLNRMTEADEPLGTATQYGYDANGDVTSVTDPRGNTTSYGYDKLGRLAEVAQPLEKTTTYTYDKASNRLTETTAAGTLEYGYNADNQLAEVKAGESTLRSLGYNADNLLSSATDAEGHKIEAGYNEDGLVNSIKDGRGQSLTRSYNSRGALTKQVDGRGTLEYGYDKLGRLTSLTDPQSKSLSFGYDPEGDPIEVKRPSGVTTTNVYNNAGRLAETTSKEEGGTVLEALKYGYDPAGNVTSRIDQRLEQETTYAYDALNRLAEFNPPGEGATSYGYDEAGNRTEAGGTTYNYNALNQLTESSDGTTYSYDGAGRMTGKINGSEETSYEWDLLDHLAKVEGLSETTSYAYDGLERLSERKSEASTQVIHYGDLTDLPNYDANGEGKTTTSYVQDSRGLTEQRSGETTSYPLADAHGDITAITGPAGGVESRQTYDPWGMQLSGPSLEMGYLGSHERLTDPTTGLIQMGARSYDPSLGSFASEDPVFGHLGAGASVDRYLYVWDNPLNRYDLNGRELCAPTPWGSACPGEGVEDVENAGESVWHTGEEAANGVSSGAEHAWNWTAPGRSWVANQAQDFWKKYGSSLESVYRFAGGNWQTCLEGASAGAASGFVIGSVVPGVGNAAGAVTGGVGGCAGLVGAKEGIRSVVEQ
jgi:RHS repeat-associated protein